MSKFTALKSMLQGMDRKEALKLLEEQLGHSTDELSTNKSLSESQYDDLANYKRELQTQENASMNPDMPVAREATEFLPDLTEEESMRRYMQWLKEADPEKAAKESSALRAGMEATKASAFAPMLKSPFSNEDGSPRDLQAELEKGVESTGKNLVNKYMKNSTPENKAFAEKAFGTLANPMNYVGGAGIIDAAMMGAEMAPSAFQALKKKLSP